MKRIEYIKKYKKYMIFKRNYFNKIKRNKIIFIKFCKFYIECKILY